MILEWSAEARHDLLDIFDYILEDNPKAALDVRKRIDRGVSRLVDHPGSGRPGRVEGTRELVIAGSPYIAPYEVRGDRVFILRVLHTARQWPDQF